MRPIVCSLVITVACTVGVSRAADGPDVKHVVLVSIDGLAASYFDDPRADMPTLRQLAKSGARAKGMITSFPSVTWPSHTSLITGVQPARHGVIGNNVWSRKLDRPLVYIGDPELTKDEAIKAPTLYDAAHRAGLTCGSVIWPCCNAASSLEWVIPDAGRADLHARYTTPGFVDELAKSGIDISQLGAWGWNKDRSTDRDNLYTQVAKYLLEKQKANLVLVHLITPDGVEHAYGPHTPEAYKAVAESDRQIAEIWDALQKPPFAGRSALFVVSDHGFAPYEKFIRPNFVLKELGLVTTDGEKVVSRKAWCVAQGGSAFLYVLDDERKKEIANQLKERFAKLEGVTSVVEPQDYAPLGLPRPEKNDEAPDLVLMTGPGYSFAETMNSGAVGPAGGGLKGNHGHDPAPDYMHATFVAAGTGIKPGVQLDQIHNVDVAPTIARLMGIALADVDGRVLDEILAK